jgi:protein gp37
MQKTNIQYADYVSNPLRAKDNLTGRIGSACVPYNDGCTNCWANNLNMRFGTQLKYNQSNLRRIHFFLDELELCKLNNFYPHGPFKFGPNPFLFICDMTDWLLPEYGDAAAEVLSACTNRPDINFLFLTKRFEELPRFWCSHKWPLPSRNIFIGLTLSGPGIPQKAITELCYLWSLGWPVWISHEPSLGPLDLPDYADFISLLVSGGETGSHARSSDPAWHRQDRDWCVKHSIPYFFKQWGKYLPAAQREGELDCQIWRRMPESEMPSPIQSTVPCYPS